MTTATAGPADIEVRALSTHADFAACVRLQYETWGSGYMDAVPGTILQVSQQVGGVAAGAFTRAGELLGFVFGLTGVRHGRLAHWSDMLAVRAGHRNRGIGRMLKQFQREQVRALGVALMYWTFDPLVARNAHLNLNILGATVDEYVVNIYGESTGSALHAFGTDRFIVSWPVAHEPVRPRVPAGARAAPLAGERVTAPVQRIEIPADVAALPLSEARQWRAATRPAFVRLLHGGYRVTGFMTEPDGGGCYVLEQC